MDLSELIKFFVGKEYSIASKFFGILILIITLLFINNLLGFSFYYSNNQKINQIKSIESLKKECSDKDIHKILNETEVDIINRKNIVDVFFGLFSKEPFDEKKESSKIKVDTVYIVRYDTIKQIQNSHINPWNYWQYDSLHPHNNKRQNNSILKSDDSIKIAYLDTLKSATHNSETNSTTPTFKSRSKIWHTISSTYGLILFLIILPFIPFTQPKFNGGMMMGILILMILLAGIIWVNQFLLGLIPVILNNPWINYIVNFGIHTTCWIVLVLLAKKNNTSNKVV